jgi:hypothetical protein
VTDFRPLHVERTGDFVLPLGLDDAFLSFTPEGERACNPSAGVAADVRFTPGSRLGTVRVCCRAVDRAHTCVTVTYALTALSPAGNDALADLTPTAYAAMLEAWRNAILRSRSRSGTEDAG